MTVLRRGSYHALMMVFLVGPAHLLWAEDVSVRFVNGRNGKPMANLPVELWSYKQQLDDKDMGAAPNFGPVSRAKTDAEGRATFHLGQPLPVRLVFHSLQYVTGCSAGSFDTKEVLTKGVVDSNLCDRKGKLKGKFSPKPGEAVVFVKPFTELDHFLREL